MDARAAEAGNFGGRRPSGGFDSGFLAGTDPPRPAGVPGGLSCDHCRGADHRIIEQRVPGAARRRGTTTGRPGCRYNPSGLGDPPRSLVVVPGSGSPGRGTGNNYSIDVPAHDRLKAAENWIARQPSGEKGQSCLFLSGWATPDGGDGGSEAEQMARSTERVSDSFLLDPAARTTAENALFAIEFGRCFTGSVPVIAFVSWSNALRFRILLRLSAGGRLPDQRVRMLTGVGHGRYWKPGLSGLFFMRRHLGAARFRVTSVTGKAFRP